MTKMTKGILRLGVTIMLAGGLAACDSTQKTDAPADATTEAPASKAAYTQSGDGVALMRKALQDFASGDIDAYRANFTEDANFCHNAWGEWESIDILADRHRAFHAELSGPIEITNLIIEMVTLDGGSKHAHAWVNFKAPLKDGTVDETFAMVAMGVNGDETELKYEWAAYDSDGLPEEAGYSD